MRLIYSALAVLSALVAVGAGLLFVMLLVTKLASGDRYVYINMIIAALAALGSAALARGAYHKGRNWDAQMPAEARGQRGPA